MFIFKTFYKSILHHACESGNVELVKYLLSLNRLDINSNDIFLLLALIPFQLKFIKLLKFFLFIIFKNSFCCLYYSITLCLHIR